MLRPVGVDILPGWRKGCPEVCPEPEPAPIHCRLGKIVPSRGEAPSREDVLFCGVGVGGEEVLTLEPIELFSVEEGCVSCYGNQSDSFWLGAGRRDASKECRTLELARSKMSGNEGFL